MIRSSLISVVTDECFKPHCSVTSLAFQKQLISLDNLIAQLPTSVILATWAAEAGESQLVGQQGLQSELKVSLSIQ